MAAELPITEGELERSGYLTWRVEQAGPYRQQIPIAREPADETQFSLRELEIVDAALAELAPHGGKAAKE